MTIEEAFYSRVKAHKAGVKHYFGMVCKRHPDLGGKRTSSNGKCIHEKDIGRARP
jgi:hypothetical protein